MFLHLKHVYLYGINCYLFCLYLLICESMFADLKIFLVSINSLF